MDGGGKFLLGRLRALLHDTGRGMCTSSTFYSDKTLLRALNDAQGTLVRMLVEQAEKMPTTLQITLNRLIAEAPGDGGRTGIDVPDDYFIPICGLGVDGRYMTAEEIRVGEALNYISPNRIYVRGGKIFGPIHSGDLLKYYRIPQPIENTDVPLVDFADNFYNVVKFVAMHSAVVQESSDAIERFKVIQAEAQAKMALLR